MRRVGITGLGVVSPIGAGTSAFFRGLREARSGIREIRSFDASTFPTRIAGEVTDPVEIPSWVEDPTGSGIDRDPKARFALAAADQALSEAFGPTGVATHCTPDRVAVMMGAGLEICHLGDLAPHVRNGQLDGGSLLEAPCGSQVQIPSHLAAAAIAAGVRARGPLSVNVSACTAGTQAVGEAFLAVREGVADVVITGGYDSMVNPLGLGGFSIIHALSRANDRPEAASRPFDVSRDGFVIGEGSGVLVLEELEGARARGARVHAEVLGYATTLDAFRVSDPDPALDGAVKAMRDALAVAGIDPAEVDYVNAHGTGTLKNDPAECRAIRRALGAAADRIPVSSTKSQIGHLIGAAGAVELIACVFALEEGTIPATVNLDLPDAECDVDHVARRPRRAEVRVALSNSFGFGGQNACLVVGTPDERRRVR